MSWSNAFTFALCACLQLSVKGFEVPVTQEAGTASQGALRSEDWEPLHYELYSRPPSASVGYDKTLELIKKLDEVYAPYSDQETNGRNWRIGNLLRASRRNPDDCNREWLEKMRDLISYNQPYAVNVVPYMRHNLAEMKEYCERNAHQILKDRVAALGQAAHDDMDSLVVKTLKGREITRMHLTQLFVRPNQLVDGIVKFMEEKIRNEPQGEGARQVRDKKLLRLDFERYVINMCDLWTRATEPLIGLREFGLHVDLDDTEHQWLRYNDICYRINEDKKSVSKKVIRRLSEKMSGTRAAKLKESLSAGLMSLNPKNCISKGRRAHMAKGHKR